MNNKDKEEEYNNIEFKDKQLSNIKILNNYYTLPNTKIEILSNSKKENDSSIKEKKTKNINVKSNISFQNYSNNNKIDLQNYMNEQANETLTDSSFNKEEIEKQIYDDYQKTKPRW